MNRAVIVRARGRHDDRPAGSAGRNLSRIDGAVVQDNPVTDAVVVLEHNLLAPEGSGIGRKRLCAVLAHDVDRGRAWGRWCHRSRGTAVTAAARNRDGAYQQYRSVQQTQSHCHVLQPGSLDVRLLSQQDGDQQRRLE